MPNISNRKKVLSHLSTHLDDRMKSRLLRMELEWEDKEEDQVDEELVAYYRYITGIRYWEPRKALTKARQGQSPVLYFLEAIRPERFKKLFRINRDYFHTIVDLIARKTQLQSYEHKMAKATIETHLLVTLKMLGSSGAGAGSDELGEFFGIGVGYVYLYLRRTIAALLELREEVICWPDEFERKEIALRIEQAGVFPNCVGFIDGTVFPLEFKPTLNGSDYFSRKSSYAVNAQVI